MLLGIAVTAHVFVPLLLGSNWGPVVPLLEVLWAVGLLRCVSNVALPVALTRGRADLGLIVNTVSTAAMVVVLLGATQIGLQAVAWAELGVVAGQLAIWWFALRREIGFSVRETGVMLARPLVAALGGATVCLGVGAAVGLATKSLTVELAAMVLAGAAAYAALGLALDRRYLRTLAEIMRPRGAPRRLDMDA
jgi:PST family polysaccharide transporter/lipopolysaccharide exporter